MGGIIVGALKQRILMLVLMIIVFVSGGVAFKNQTVMAIKAPPEAKLQVPHPSEVTKHYNLFIFRLALEVLKIQVRS